MAERRYIQLINGNCYRAPLGWTGQVGTCFNESTAIANGWQVDSGCVGFNKANNPNCTVFVPVPIPVPVAPTPQPVPVGVPVPTAFVPAVATINLHFENNYNVDGRRQVDDCNGYYYREIDYDFRVGFQGGTFSGQSVYSSDFAPDLRFIGGSDGNTAAVAASYSGMRSPESHFTFRRVMISIPRLKAAGYTGKVRFSLFVTRRTQVKGDTLYIGIGSSGGAAGDMIATPCLNGIDFYVQNITVTTDRVAKNLFTYIATLIRDQETYIGYVELDLNATTDLAMVTVV